VAPEHWIARSFQMDEATWARHANPWSVWTRVATLPVLLLALSSHVWIGWWSLVAVLGVSLWTWVNPRLFRPPVSTRSWASRATFGERIWLNRQAIPIPGHHARAAALLSIASATGFLISVYGAIAIDATALAGGGVLAWTAKMWFVDRMVWLYEDMKDHSPEYRSWLR
jgi:hypothetical protein